MPDPQGCLRPLQVGCRAKSSRPMCGARDGSRRHPPAIGLWAGGQGQFSSTHASRRMGNAASDRVDHKSQKLHRRVKSGRFHRNMLDSPGRLRGHLVGIGRRGFIDAGFIADSPRSWVVHRECSASRRFGCDAWHARWRSSGTVDRLSGTLQVDSSAARADVLRGNRRLPWMRNWREPLPHTWRSKPSESCRNRQFLATFVASLLGSGVVWRYALQEQIAGHTQYPQLSRSADASWRRLGNRRRILRCDLDAGFDALCWIGQRCWRSPAAAPSLGWILG